jgi:hypothetical protein
MALKRSYLHTVAKVLPDSIYLAGMRAVVTTLSQASLNNQWQRYTKRRLGVERSPMWASELYQLIALAGGLALIAWLPDPGRVQRLLKISLGVVALFRLFEVMLFALHWVFVDRRPVKDFRRSLLAFSLGLIELAVFATLILFWCTGGFSGSRWALLYAVAGAVFTQSLPRIEGIGAQLLLHLVIGEAWLLLLVVIAVVVSGITRGELGSGNSAA